MPVEAPETLRRPNPNNWVTTNSGNIYYRPSNRKKSANSSSARFPRPLIEPRRTRPHAIHIITYPPGYVPHELRPKPESSNSRVRKIKVRAARAKRQLTDANSDLSADNVDAPPGPERRTERSPIRPVLGKILGSRFTSNYLQTSSRRASTIDLEPCQSTEGHRATATATPTATSPSTSVCDVIRQAPETTDHQSSEPTERSHPTVNHTRTATDSTTTTLAAPSTTSSRRASAIEPLSRVASDSAAITGNPRLRPQPRANTSTLAHKRNSLMSVRTAKSAVSSVTELQQKPVATGSGVTCSIILQEPNIFLSGFDHDGHSQREGQGGTALLRGKMQLNVSKNVKIKAIQLRLVGKARTEWPEGIPPLKQETHEEQGLRTQVLTFFNAMNGGWTTEYGNQCTYKLKSPPEKGNAATYLVVAPPTPGGPATSTRDLKRLSLQNAQSRSFGKNESSSNEAALKGFKIFYPGTYDYAFELPLDHHQLETIKLQYGSVKWELQASVDRAGAFKPNLHGTKEVPIIRVPDQMSLEMSEPISISRQWEDQLHYDIIISGKSFPIGGKIPIAFKLTPLAKVQVHKLKVFVTESIEYWTNDRRVTRKDPGRKILLLEKAAGKGLDPQYASSELRTLRGGELSQEQRSRARDQASNRRAAEAGRHGEAPRPLPTPSDNILGDLDLGLESYWGSTELEANVQIPTCEMMAKNKDQRLHPDCSWKNVNVYHWIKIVMRISRLDPDDPTGKKRRHFEISIDSPFTVLNCRATQANTVLPAYGNPSPGTTLQSSCGCHDAHVTASDPSPLSSATNLNRVATDMMPSMPQAAHVNNTAMNPASEQPAQNQEPRPMHLLRAPSFNPPAFDEDHAPPPLQVDTSVNSSATNLSNGDMPLTTPPPQYDVVVGTPSVDGLADYFTRLADYGYDPEDSDSGSDSGPPRILERSGRVNVAHPRTPGGRMQSRSMEISRPPINLNMNNLANHRSQVARG